MVTVADHRRVSARIHRAAEDRKEIIPEGLRQGLDEVIRIMSEALFCPPEVIIGMGSYELTAEAASALEKLKDDARATYGDIFA